MRRLKIGLTAVAVQKDVHGYMWTNGMTQNLVYLGLLLQRMRCVEQVYTVPIPNDPEPHHPSVVFGFKQIALEDAVRELDILIEICVRVPNEEGERFRARGGKLVSYVAGNSFIMNLEALANNAADRGEVLPTVEFDAAWLTPQHWRTNRSYTVLTRTPHTHKVSQIWDPAVLRQGVAGINHNFFYKRRLKKGVSVGVFEPNINVVKTFHFPVLVCEALFRRQPDAVHHVYASNTYHLRENPHVAEFFSSLDLLKMNRLTSEGRFPTYQLLGQYVDTVVVHHWENGLNYLYYDVLYGGFPLVHNSEFLRDVGYYYDAFDVQAGADALERAWQTHDDQFDRYREAAQELLWTVSPENPDLQREHQRLLEALYDR